MVFDVGTLLVVLVLAVCAAAGNSMAAAAAVKHAIFQVGVFIVAFLFLVDSARSARQTRGCIGRFVSCAKYIFGGVAQLKNANWVRRAVHPYPCTRGRVPRFTSDATAAALISSGTTASG